MASLDLIQLDLVSVHRWSLSNGLKFHPLKCKILPFNYNLTNDLVLGDIILPVVDSIEDPGLTVRNNLSWNEHIQIKLGKCHRILNFMKRHVPISTHTGRKKLLHQSLLLSVLLYGYPAWNASISSIRALENFQKKVMHRIYPKCDYVSGLQSLDLLPICFELIKIDLVLL